MTAPVRHLVLELDGPAGAHLVRALRTHRAWCKANGCAVPAVLDQFALRLSATAGQGRPSVDPDEDLAQAAPVLLTFLEAAEQLRVSERSVRRLVASGQLRSVRVGGSSRIHRDDLVAFAERLRETA